MTRGERLNNPCCIRKSQSPWLGKLISNTDPDFEAFTDIVFGFRAALVIVRRYIRAYRLDTPTAIINRWAPISENNTANYVKVACQKSGLDPFQRLHYNDKNALCHLVWAMAFVECGRTFSYGEVEIAWSKI